MVSLQINGSDSSMGGNSGTKMTDLIELIKASIDPEHIIISILIDGRDLTEEDWNATLGQFGTSIIEVQTGKPEDFVADRLGTSPEVLRTCFMQFREARKAFQNGEMLQGNQVLLGAVNTAKAFFEWYATLLQLIPDTARPRYDITKQVEEISSICKRICQQQLYQSWWALGETLEKELEPKLDKLEDFCRGFRQAV